MKKNILTLVSGMLLHLSYAQDKPEMPTCVIINGALNLVYLERGDYFFYLAVNPGFSGGAMLRTSGDFFVLTGLQYVSVNPTMTSKSVTDPKSGKVSLQMLQLPVMFGAQVVKSHDSQRTLHAQLGASFSSLLGVSSNDLGIEKDNLNNTALNFRAGIGADLWMFTFDINYNLLLSHLYDITGYNNEAHLICWEFSLGYKINLNKKEIDHGE